MRPIPARVLQLEHPLRGAEMIVVVVVVRLVGGGVEHAQVLRELRVVQRGGLLGTRFLLIFGATYK